MAKNDTGGRRDDDTAIAPPASTGAITTERATVSDGDTTDTLIIKDRSMTDKLRDNGLTDRLREGSEKLANQAGDKARGFVSQGLERTSETLTNVSKMVGDTADGIDERLGKEYGDYARKAADAIDKAAASIGAKNPDELIEDTRTFVRNSPGVALAGAAVVGFALARLLKNGLASPQDDEA